MEYVTRDPPSALPLFAEQGKVPAAPVLRPAAILGRREPAAVYPTNAQSPVITSSSMETEFSVVS